MPESSHVPLWDDIRGVLENAHAVLLGQATDMGKARLQDRTKWYTAVFKQVNEGWSNYPDQLRTVLSTWIAKQLDGTAKTAILAAVEDHATSPAQLFQVVASQWAAWQRLTQLANAILLFIDTGTFAHNKPRVKAMFNLAFHDAVYKQIKTPLRQVILEQIDVRRNGDRIDMASLKQCVSLFDEVGTSTSETDDEKLKVYEADLQTAYLEKLEDFYSKVCATERSREGSHFTYLQWVEDKIGLETMLAQTLLRKASGKVVRSRADDVLLKPYFRDIVEHPDSGFGVLLEEGKVQDLHRMYELLKRVTEADAPVAVQCMGAALEERVRLEATEAMQNFNSATSDGPLSLERPLVTAMVELNAKYGGLIQERFEGSGIFYDCRKKAFNAVLKQKLERTDPKPGVGEGATEKKATSFPEVLATFCDAVMKRELKDVVDADAELERLDALLQVFTYVEEKDVFQEFYKARLAKRLLQTTPNEDLEKAFLERLQRENGKSFTHKMEGMLLDRESTKKHSEEFKLDAAGSSLESEFDVQVLTEANWPAYRADALTPPVSLRRCMDAFTRFYKKKYATRKLTWFNLLGSGVLRVTFAKGAKDVTLSLHQAAVLLTIDERGRASVREVGESMGLDAKGAKPHVASMYLHKAFGMLRRVDASGAPQPAAKTIGDEDLLELNDGFVHKMRKFKVPQAHVSSHGSSGMPTEQEIDARRKIQVDACVVRIMKSRRTLSYPELQDLVIQQLGKIFTPQPKLVKQRVEDLVNREYLRRHDDDPKNFDYLA